jgi:hypothetical protein
LVEALDQVEVVEGVLERLDVDLDRVVVVLPLERISCLALSSATPIAPS